VSTTLSHLKALEETEREGEPSLVEVLCEEEYSGRSEKVTAAA